jgi:uncharacterized membrane protein YfcA
MVGAVIVLPSTSDTALLVAAAFGTSLLSAVAGFGGGMLLLAASIAVLGPRNAVVVVTIAQLASTGGRMWFNHTEIDRRLVAVFSLGAVPGAAAGALLLAAMPTEDTLARIIGGCLLALVLWRRFHPAAMHLPDAVFVAVGAASGIGSGLLGSVGPLVAEFFLARGLVHGAYIGTNAAANLLMHITKLAVYGAAAVLTHTTGLLGLVLVPASLAGSWTGKKIVDRLPPGVFSIVVELALVAAGVALLIGGSS